MEVKFYQTIMAFFVYVLITTPHWDSIIMGSGHRYPWWVMIFCIGMSVWVSRLIIENKRK